MLFPSLGFPDLLANISVVVVVVVAAAVVVVVVVVVVVAVVVVVQTDLTAKPRTPRFGALAHLGLGASGQKGLGFCVSKEPAEILWIKISTP